MSASGCSVINALAGIAPDLCKDFSVSITYSRGNEAVETYWKGGQWLWVLRDKSEGKIKGCGYCWTAKMAIQMAFEAASFVTELALEKTAAPEPQPLEKVLAPIAQSDRHYRTEDVRFAR